MCETKPMLSGPPQVNCQNNNGNYRASALGLKSELLPPDVARLVQLEEGVRPAPAHPHRRKPPLPPRHGKNKDHQHCAIDMNGIETNV